MARKAQALETTAGEDPGDFSEAGDRTCSTGDGRDTPGGFALGMLRAPAACRAAERKARPFSRHPCSRA